MTAAGDASSSTFLYGQPRVSSIEPRSGPYATPIAIRGDLLPFARGVGASGGYRCQFIQQR